MKRAHYYDCRAGIKSVYIRIMDTIILSLKFDVFHTIFTYKCDKSD